MTPSLTFDALLAEIGRRKSRQTAALYAHLVATHGAGSAPFMVDLAAFAAELAARHAGTDLFTRAGSPWSVAVGLWELRYLGLSRPALGAAGRPQRLVVWLSDVTVVPGPHTRTARLRLSPLPDGDAWPGVVLATF